MIIKENLDKVFKAYDIRGLMEDGLDEEFYFVLGQAFVTYLGAKKIVVGYDIRPESRLFSESFIEGAVSLGCDVVAIGEIATEMMYFAVGSDAEVDGGATITASHNPAGWNGCKMVGKGVKPLSGDEGLPEVKQLMLENNFEKSEDAGSEEQIDIWPSFKQHILRVFDGVEPKPLKLLVDAGNGIGGVVFDYVFSDLSFEVEKMYFEPDGNFPNHVPDPLKEENVVEIKKGMKTGKYDLGIAIDGDADRAFFIDSKGRKPNGVYVGAMFARYFAKHEKDAKFIQDPRLTWPFSKEVEKYGGTPFEVKAGHSFFKHYMKKEDAVFGAEMSAHFYYRDFFYADSGMMTIATMLRLIFDGVDFEEENTYFFGTYPTPGEVNFQVGSVADTIEKAEQHYSDGNIKHIDGVSIEYDNWRFNLRGSNTQPLIRLNVEAENRETVVEKYRELEKLIGGERDNVPEWEELK